MLKDVVHQDKAYLDKLLNIQTVTLYLDAYTKRYKDFGSTPANFTI